VKKAQHLAAGDGGFCSAGLGASGASVQMDKGVELGLKGFDAAEMGLENFYGRNFPGADAGADFGNGGEGRNVGHKRKCENIRA